MRRIGLLLACMLAAPHVLAPHVLAQPRGLPAAPPRPVVVELFTSQGCSSCPPADALLGELARRPDVLALGFHVTYWDRMGWRDPWSLEAATRRQQGYRDLLGVDSIYTPQMIVDGRLDVVGSDRAAVAQAIAAAAALRQAGPAIALRREGAEAVVTVGGGAGRFGVLVVGYDPAHRTPVARGENAGRTLNESNVVRAVVPTGVWRGEAESFRIRLPAGERLAAILQGADGRIAAAATEAP